MNKKIFDVIAKEDEPKQLKLFSIKAGEIQIVTSEKGLEEFHNALKEEFEKQYGKVSSNSEYSEMMKQKMIVSGRFKKVK